MDYEWDPAKSRANFAKHGIRFADATSALEDELALTIADPDCDEEERWVTLGIDLLHRFIVVVWTSRGEAVRLISARRATAGERHQYEKDNQA